MNEMRKVGPKQRLRNAANLSEKWVPFSATKADSARFKASSQRHRIQKMAFYKICKIHSQGFADLKLPTPSIAPGCHKAALWLSRNMVPDGET